MKGPGSDGLLLLLLLPGQFIRRDYNTPTSFPLPSSSSLLLSLNLSTFLYGYDYCSSSSSTTDERFHFRLMAVACFDNWFFTAHTTTHFLLSTERPTPSSRIARRSPRCRPWRLIKHLARRPACHLRWIINNQEPSPYSARMSEGNVFSSDLYVRRYDWKGYQMILTAGVLLVDNKGRKS